MRSCDVIVIGGGVNGLACAARLAAKGCKVTLLESAATLGGGMALAHTTQGIDPRVMAGMALDRHGLRFHAPLSTTVLGAAPLSVSGGKTTGPDAAAFAALHQKLADFARVLTPFRTMTAPRLATRGNEWGKLLRYGLGVRALGRADFRELLRMILINIADVSEDELTDDRLKGLLCFDATLGAWLGPRSPNSLILLLNRLSMGAQPLRPVGGMASVATAMARAAVAAGVTLISDAKVARITVDNDRACGVTLANGQDLRADMVVSAISPRLTFQTLVGPRHLDAGFYTRSHHIRSRGGAAKLHLTLTSAPEFDADPQSRLVIAPSVNAVENAFNPVKYGDIPDRPVMEIILPHAFDTADPPSLSAIVQFAPHAPKAGLEAARAQMLDNTLRVLEAQSPGLRNRIAQAEFLMPYDIEARYGMVGGNWHHGELAVEQMLFNRPLPGAAHYATPLPGLWLSGAGSHPGGGINGTAGWNAAERILQVTP